MIEKKEKDGNEKKMNIEEVLLTTLKEQLHRNGYVKIPSTIFSLNDEVIGELRTEFDQLFDGQYATGIYPDEIHWRKGISKERNITKELCNGWKASHMIRNIVTQVHLGKLACMLMDWDACRLGQDDIIHKPPQSMNPVGFHQDGTYISDNFVPRENNCLTMWMSLDDVDEENGALQYAPGSHLWLKNYKNNKTGKESTTTTADDASNKIDDRAAQNVSSASFHVFSSDSNDDDDDDTTTATSTDNGKEKIMPDYMKSLRQAANDVGLDVGQVIQSVETVTAKAGELIVHHQNVWHGSCPNTSRDRHRRALVVHLIDGYVRWKIEPPTKKQPHYIYGRYYIRGETFLRDDFFPVTYSKNTSNDNNTAMTTSKIENLRANSNQIKNDNDNHRSNGKDDGNVHNNNNNHNHNDSDLLIRTPWLDEE